MFFIYTLFVTPTLGIGIPQFTIPPVAFLQKGGGGGGGQTHVKTAELVYQLF